jgi:hypothetical protein
LFPSLSTVNLKFSIKGWIEIAVAFRWVWNVINRLSVLLAHYFVTDLIEAGLFTTGKYKN